MRTENEDQRKTLCLIGADDAPDLIGADDAAPDMYRFRHQGGQTPKPKGKGSANAESPSLVGGVSRPPAAQKNNGWIWWKWRSSWWVAPGIIITMMRTVRRRLRV
jgi:hypothetical protein